jgi:molecular chaperone DnaK
VTPLTAGARPPNIRSVTSLPLVRVRLKHIDPETFVQRFAPNVTRGGIFLASRDPRPVGALVRFEVALVSGAVMLAGQGRVAWVKPYDAAEPTRAHGMGVQFTELDPATRPMFERLLARKDAAAGKVAPARGSAGSGGVTAPASSSGSGERRVTEGNLGEFDALEDTALRRALDRARAIGSSSDQLDELLSPVEPAPAVTLAEALADLPRYFARGRGSGLFRLPSEVRAGAPASAVPEAASGPPAFPASPTEAQEPPRLASSEGLPRSPEAPSPPEDAAPAREESAAPELVADEATRRLEPLEPGSEPQHPRPHDDDDRADPHGHRDGPINGVPPNGR